MSFSGANYLAIALAAAASFLFGGVWYGALSQAWLGAIDKTEDDIRKAGRSMPFLFALTIVAQLVMAWVLAGILGHMGPGQVTLRTGLITAFLCWLGFVMTTLIVNHGYQGSRWSLSAIDGGHWLGVLLIQGAIIGWMGVR